MKKLEIGKLDNERLKELIIDKIGYKDTDVAIKAAVGEDCAYLDFSEDYCVVSTDPITASVANVGKLAVNVSCNDIASAGVRPFAILMSLMLPECSSVEDIDTIMDQASREAANLKVEIAGGHTEITKVVNAPVIVATAIGKAPKDKTLAQGGVSEGDVLLVTKSVGLEGISIIASDCNEKLKEVLSCDELAKAKSFEDMTSVLKEGVIAGEVGVSAMHDITEGGVLGAVWEVCQMSKKGAIVYDEQIPVEEVTKKACAALNIDYRRLISSGSMLIVVSENKKKELVSEIEKAGISISEIGKITAREEGVKIEESGAIKELAPSGSDELYKVIN